MSLTPERESIIHSIIGKARQDIPHPHSMVHRQSAVVKSLLQHVGEDGDGGALINERVKQILRGILIDNAKFLVSLSLSANTIISSAHSFLCWWIRGTKQSPSDKNNDLELENVSIIFPPLSLSRSYPPPPVRTKLHPEIKLDFAGSASSPLAIFPLVASTAAVVAAKLTN